MMLLPAVCIEGVVGVVSVDEVAVVVVDVDEDAVI